MLQARLRSWACCWAHLATGKEEGDELAEQEERVCAAGAPALMGALLGAAGHGSEPARFMARRPPGPPTPRPPRGPAGGGGAAPGAAPYIASCKRSHVSLMPHKR